MLENYCYFKFPEINRLSCSSRETLSWSKEKSTYFICIQQAISLSIQEM